MNLKETIQKLNFDYINSDITEKNFPKPKVQAIKLGKEVSSEEALRLLDEKGLRPATLYELLDYAKEWNGEDYVVALGSVWRYSDGDRSVPFLYRFDDERELNLGCWDGVWVDYWFFAAVSKYVEISDTKKSDFCSLESLELLKKEFSEFKDKVTKVLKL